jgi:hypothetical protein
MPFIRGKLSCILPTFALALASVCALGQNAGAIHGAVTDPSGAVIPGATVHLGNTGSGLARTATSDALGQYSFANVPFNPYRIDASATGFAPLSQSTEIRSVVGITLNLVLQVATASQTVTVEAQGDLVETDPTFHTDVDRDMFIKVPMELAGYGHHAGRLRGLERPVPRPRRPCVKLILGGRAVHHRSAEQNLFQSDSVEFDSVD